MNVLGIDFTFFAVSNMQESISFYRDVLGIPLTVLAHEGKRIYISYIMNEIHLSPRWGLGLRYEYVSIHLSSLWDCRIDVVSILAEFLNPYISLIKQSSPSGATGV